MGILDSFLDNPEQAGLLNAAAQMLAASGPSTMPRSFGQVLASGIGGLQQGASQAMAHQAARQNFDINNIKMRDAESDLKNQELVRARQAQIQAELIGGVPAAAPQAQPAPLAPMGGSIMAGMGSQMPSWMPQQPARASAPAASSAPSDMRAAEAARLMQEAAVYKKYGDIDGANKRYEAAIKIMPEFSQTPQVGTGADGKPFTYVLDKSGNKKVLDGVLPRDKMEVMTLGGHDLAYNPYALKEGQTFQRTLTPGERQTQANADSDGLGPLTPQAIENAAARYNFDGTLPPMGMGKAAAAGRSKILNRAAELANGVAPSDQRTAQLDNKNEASARGKAYRDFTGDGKSSQAIQSANTGLNHLETVRQLALAQKSGDIKAFNQAARTLGAAFGQTAPTNLNAALIMVAPEISKAVVGAGGTGAEREHALQALNPNGSPDQIIGGIGTMQELFAGRLSESKRTYERSTKRNDFDSFLSPAAKKLINHESPAVDASAIPQAAKSYLKMNPKMRAEFDAKYGAGAAAAVLGK